MWRATASFRVWRSRSLSFTYCLEASARGHQYLEPPGWSPVPGPPPHTHTQQVQVRLKGYLICGFCHELGHSGRLRALGAEDQLDLVGEDQAPGLGTERWPRPLGRRTKTPGHISGDSLVRKEGTGSKRASFGTLPGDGKAKGV